MKKSLSLKLFALVAAMMCALGASAYSFQTGGIYYNVTSQPNRTVEVTYMDASYYSLGAYDGNITILLIAQPYGIPFLGVFNIPTKPMGTPSHSNNKHLHDLLSS